MKRKTPISTRARLKSPNNPPRGRYRTGGLDDAALKVQQTSEAQFHGLLEENPDAIIIVGRTGHIDFASNRIEAMFGYLPNELFGKPLGVLIPERYRDLHLGHLDRFMSAPDAHDQELSLVFLDLDYFKRVVDTHGHLLGSKILKEVAQTIHRELNDDDRIVRYGGDEFVVILPRQGKSQALAKVQRMRRAIVKP